MEYKVFIKKKKPAVFIMLNASGFLFIHYLFISLSHFSFYFEYLDTP